MIEATEADREIARDIEDRCVNRHNIVAGDLPSAIALALATAREEGRKAPKGCVVDDEGRVRDAEVRWECSFCNVTYAEYMNGCPRCHLGEVGTSTSVQRVLVVRAAQAAKEVVNG